MPIVIMKTNTSPIAMDWIRPHAVWNGTLKAAIEWCKAKNDHPNNYMTQYEAVMVKNEGKAANAEITDVLRHEPKNQKR